MGQEHSSDAATAAAADTGGGDRSIQRANSLPARGASFRKSVSRALKKKKKDKTKSSAESSTDSVNRKGVSPSNFLLAPGGSSPAMLRSAPASPSGGSSMRRIRTQSFVVGGFDSKLGIVGQRNEDGVLMRPKKKKEPPPKVDDSLEWQDSNAFADPEAKEVFPTSRNSLQLFDLPDDFPTEEQREQSPTRGKLSNQSSFSKLSQQGSFAEEDPDATTVEVNTKQRLNLPIIRQETVDDDDLAWLDNAQTIIQNSGCDSLEHPNSITGEEQRDSGVVVVSDAELQAVALKKAEDDTQQLMTEYAGKLEHSNGTFQEEESVTASLLTELDGFIDSMMDGIDV